ncbi:MAG TPA: hypothetical protein VHZ81_04585 [Galbitalea sp.]|jgi:hypothetical protein|nr:hypothetical protein [Galbitalea sp.]
MTIVPGDKPPLADIPGGAAIGRGLDRVLAVQRPVVLAHIRSIRRSRPLATPAEVIRTLERRYLAAVTTGGALVGATAAIPAVGTVASIALSTAETAGFLEASALFAQSVTEVHGIAVTDPERARTLVMTMILGGAGSELVEQLASEVVGVGPVRSAFWGELVTKNIPKSAVGGIARRMRSFFLKKFAASEGAGIVGRAIPFGIGAVIGGAGNHFLGRRVVSSSRTAFGPAPENFPAELVASPSQKPAKRAFPR